MNIFLVSGGVLDGAGYSGTRYRDRGSGGGGGGGGGVVMRERYRLSHTPLIEWAVIDKTREGDTWERKRRGRSSLIFG